MAKINEKGKIIACKRVHFKVNEILYQGSIVAVDGGGSG